MSSKPVQDHEERARETVAQAVRSLCEKDGRTDTDIARAAWPSTAKDSARRHLDAVCRGALWLGAKKAQQLADALGVELGQIYGGAPSSRKQ